MPADTALDALDLKILRSLQNDGRLTNQALAEQVSLSASACLARVRRLEKAGVIRGYQASVAAAAVGMNITLFAEVTLTRHNANDFTRFETEVRRLDHVVEVAQVSGSYDYLLKVAVPDMSAWIAISDALMEGTLMVARITTLVLLKETKPFQGYPL